MEKSGDLAGALLDFERGLKLVPTHKSLDKKIHRLRLLMDAMDTAARAQASGSRAR